jgi:transposase
MNRPGFLGGSIPWKEGWSYANEGAPATPGHPAVHRCREGASRPPRTPARKELGTDQGTVGRVARQLGYSEESVRSWVKQADIDQGAKPGTTTADAERMKALK